MEENKEISALLHLIDDPDEEVFSTVGNRIISLGKDIIPNLEHLWETTPQTEVQERIESLIHRLHYQELQTDVLNWSKQAEPDLIDGAFLVSRYSYPDLQIQSCKQELEKIRRSIWLELNSYLTALEQVNVVNKVLFSHHKFKGTEVSYQHQDEFMLNKVLEKRHGNSITNGIIYQYVCQMLDIPVRAIQIPRQYILAYCGDAQLGITEEPFENNIYFFIDPTTGQVYTQKDVNKYMGRLQIESTPHHFKPMSNQKIIRMLMEEYAKCHEDSLQEHRHTELLRLAEMLA